MLDLKGRPHFLQAIPPRLQEDRFTPVTPTWVPPVFGDVRAAWTGVYPDRPDIPIRVEATAWRGQPVHFQIFEPWSATTIGTPVARQRVTPGAVLAFALFCAVVIGAFFLSRRNLSLSRGDEVGAFRLALVLCLLHVVAGLIARTSRTTCSPRCAPWPCSSGAGCCLAWWSMRSTWRLNPTSGVDGPRR